MAACYVHGEVPEKGCADCAKEQQLQEFYAICREHGVMVDADRIAWLRSMLAWGPRWCPHCRQERHSTPASDNGQLLCDCCRTPTLSLTEVVNALRQTVAVVLRYFDEEWQECPICHQLQPDKHLEDKPCGMLLSIVEGP